MEALEPRSHDHRRESRRAVLLFEERVVLLERVVELLAGRMVLFEEVARAVVLVAWAVAMEPELVARQVLAEAVVDLEA